MDPARAGGGTASTSSDASTSSKASTTSRRAGAGGQPRGRRPGAAVCAARRRGGSSSRSPGSPSRSRSSSLGGPVFALAMVAIGLLCLREYFLMTAELRPVQMAAYIAVVGDDRRRLLRHRLQRPPARDRVLPAALLLRRPAPPPRGSRRLDGRDRARRRLDRPAAGPRGAAARAARPRRGAA